MSLIEKWKNSLANADGGLSSEVEADLRKVIDEKLEKHDELGSTVYDAEITIVLKELRQKIFGDEK